jgi:signal transduction histidine kinase
MNKSSRIAAAVAAALLIGLASLIQLRFKDELASARGHFIEEQHAEAQDHVRKMTHSLRSIYENLRMLAVLPSVRTAKRHGENFSEEGLITFQQIYNNLADNVAVSEVYILPIDFAPDKIDPVTLKKEAPIIAFDQLIVDPGNGVAMAQRRLQMPGTAASDYTGPPQIEDFEYAQFTQHARWLKEHYPDLSHVNGIAMPWVTGPEVILCDNTRFVSTGNDKDRSGIIFTVPFFGMDGQLKGMISAMMLSGAVKDLLPTPNLALVNAETQYSAEGDGIAHMGAAQDLVVAGKPDPALIYSEATALPLPEGNSAWSLWSGTSNTTFWASKEVADAHNERRNGVIILLFTALAVAALVSMAQRTLTQARALAFGHERARINAEKSGAEATLAADQLRQLNEDVSHLNSELSARLKDLGEAQEEIIKRGRMAQLGNLVATVAHEIRNPLASIRNTLFLLERKLKDGNIDADAQFLRIETGILRCDSIITQLLDFSRSQRVECSVRDLAGWLQNLLEDEAGRVDPAIVIKLVLPEVAMPVGFDPERLRRAVINIFSNACEALVMRLAQEPGFKPEVRLDLSQATRGAEIKITDNGPGIPAELLAKVGEPFFTSKSFGSGLGVAAAMQVAQLHGGGLEVHSIVGQGASFTIWLPTIEVKVRAA